MATYLQIVVVILTLNVVHRVVGQTGDTRPRQIAGYPVDSAYRQQDRAPTPVTEEESSEQQQQQQQQKQQQQQQQQQQALSQQAFAQLLGKQQQYSGDVQQLQTRLSHQQQQQYTQQQQLYQQQQQIYQQQQQIYQQQRQPFQQQLQKPDDSLASTVALLGVKYSAAPAVARTVYRTNTGVNFSY